MSWTDAQRTEWLETCQRQRLVARAAPCLTNGDKQLPQYYFRHLDTDREWSLSMTLEVSTSGLVWHGCASVLQDVPTGGPFAAVEQRLLPLQLWTKEHFTDARAILADLFGELIRPNDNSQEAHELRAWVVLHWFIPYDQHHNALGMEQRV